MFLRSFRRSSRLGSGSRINIKAIAILTFALFLLDLIFLTWNRLSASTKPYPLLLDHHQPDGGGGIQKKIYIASIHWNNEAIIRSNWTTAVLDLVSTFGPENVYVSVYESGSWDDSKGALRVLDEELERIGVQRTITLDPRTHAEDIAQTPASTGWIDTPRGKKELRRIPYLSRLRNLSLKPLSDLALNGIIFDYILFLNDVVFTTQDVQKLLATRNGDYAAVCSLDFAKPPAYYDTFALRDSAGYETVMPEFPYFRTGASRNAIVSGQPVPVRSCWNGIVAFDAKPFYGIDRIYFRGISDSLAKHHIEASECCLIHIDNPLSTTKGVWLNPDVRVGYSSPAYEAVNSGNIYPGLAASVRGVWKNRLWRWIVPAGIQNGIVKQTVKRWMKENGQNYEHGEECLVNEMQVLIANGWAHV